MKALTKTLKSRVLPLALVLFLLCSFPIVASAEPATLTVGAGETYMSIQAAVDDAAAGDTILVEAGTYTENILIETADITLQSVDGAATTIISSAATGTDVFNIDQPGVTIDGFTILADAAYGIYLDDGAFSATITDNVIRPKDESTCVFAVFINEVLNATSTITGNTISDCEYGVYVYYEVDEAVVDISDNSLTDCDYAICLNNNNVDAVQSVITICNNTITTSIDAIFLNAVINGSITISGNLIDACSNAGITIDELDQGSMDISNNTITDCYDGIYLSGNYFGEDAPVDITITDNELLRCSDYGLYFYGIARGTLLVTRNTATDCAYGLCVEETGENYVIDSKVTYNVVNASGDDLNWTLNEGISLCCPEQVSYLSFNKVSGYEYGIYVDDIGCCGIEPVSFTVNSNEVSDCVYGFYFCEVPCCMAGNINIINNTAKDNSYFGMYICEIGRYETQVDIMGNVFEGSPMGLYVHSINEDNADVYIHYNGFIGNTISFSIDETFDGIDATANWWAKAEGPSTIDAGAGDIDKSSAAESLYTPWVTSVAFSQSSLSLSTGQTSQLSLIADLSDDTTADVTEYAVRYTSSNEAVATVSETGLVTAVGGGSAVITANCMGYVTAPSITVTVDTPYYVTVTHKITASAGTGGSISPTGSVTVFDGNSKTFTITADSGYEINNVLVDGVSVGTAATYKFEDVSGNHSIEASFKKAAGVAGAYDDNFIDIFETDWFYDEVVFVYEQGLMNGAGSGRFDPSGTMTRGMIATVLYRLDGSPSTTAVNPFSDVADGTWYTDAVIWAAENGIVNGYDSDTYGTNDPVTREEVVSMLYRYAVYKGYDVSVGLDTNILSYDDAFEISEYAVPAVQWACGAGILGGRTGNSINPTDTASRAEVAAMLMRFVENVVV